MCNFKVTPLAKGVQPYLCRRPDYADGWCKQHHPEIIRKKHEEDEERSKKWREQKEKGNALTIDNAILLLIKNGYRVELISNKQLAIPDS